MANSEIIPGTDCGHVSKIVPKFAKSTKVGKLQGESTNQISTTDTAAKNAEDAAQAARDAAELAKAVGGKAAEGAAKDAEDAATKADELATKATEASGALDTELGNAKNEDLSKTGPYAMPETIISKLKKKKAAAASAAAAADQGAAVALEEAADCQKEMLKSAEGALKLISKVVADTTATIELAKELKQNGTWAVKDVQTLDKAVDDLRDELDKKIDDKEHEDQKPVFEGIDSNLAREMTGAKEAATDLKSKVVDSGDLPSKIKDAEDKVKPLAETELEMKRTGLPPDNIGKSMGKISECETALKALKEQMFLVDQGVKSCVKPMKRVDKQVKKAKEFDIPWAAPPMTPLGAVGAGKGEGGVKKGFFF
jgi:hypothetical protein